MAAISKNSQSAPPITGLILAFISAALLLFIVALVLFAGPLIRQRVIYSNLEKAVEAGDLEIIKQEVNDYFVRLPLESLVAYDTGSLSSDLRTLLSVGIPPVISLLKEAHYQEAAMAFSSNLSPHLNSLKIHSNQSNSVPDITALKANFTEFSTDAAFFNEQLQDAPEQIAAIERQMKDNLHLMEDLVRKTSDFFHLYPEDFNQQDYDTPRFYSSGVLDGLPRLKGLPDDIADLQSLRELLTTAGGRVELKGSNVPELFQQTLTELKHSAGIFENQLEELENERVRLKAEHANYSEKIAAQAEELIEQLKTLLLFLLKPEAIEIPSPLLNIHSLTTS